MEQDDCLHVNVWGNAVHFCAEAPLHEGNPEEANKGPVFSLQIH